MDRHELDKMFDALTPDPVRERELLRQLLQENMRRKKTMKNWKRVVLAVAVAALLVTGAAAAVFLPRIDQRVLDRLNVDPDNSEAVNEAVDLLYPGAMELDITKEDNGATLHVTQILRDRYTVMILADFTAPEGTQLYMGEPNAPERDGVKGFNLSSANSAYFLDEAGERIGDGLVASYGWDMLEDNNPMDNCLSLMFTLTPQQGENAAWSAASLRVPADDLGYWDWDQEEIVTAYEGDWSFEVPLPQKDIGWAIPLVQVLGELDGAAIYAQNELYLSPIYMNLGFQREGGDDFSTYGSSESEERTLAFMRWTILGNDDTGVTLTTADGETINVRFEIGNSYPDGREITYRLLKVIDPAKFQGGTLTLDWECGKTIISLDDLAPVDPTTLTAE